MEKTALQQLIEKWEREKGSYIPNAPIFQCFIDDAKAMLPTEKQQIINAFNYAQIDLGMEAEDYLEFMNFQND